MTKSDVINQLAKKTGLTKKDAQKALDTTLDLIVGSCGKGEKITFAGFGTFEPVKRASTTRMNPQTGQKIQVPAKTVPKFRAGKLFKQVVSKRR